MIPWSHERFLLYGHVTSSSLPDVFKGKTTPTQPSLNWYFISWLKGFYHIFILIAKSDCHFQTCSFFFCYMYILVSHDAALVFVSGDFILLIGMLVIQGKTLWYRLFWSIQCLDTTDITTYTVNNLEHWNNTRPLYMWCHRNVMPIVLSVFSGFMFVKFVKCCRFNLFLLVSVFMHFYCFII